MFYNVKFILSLVHVPYLKKKPCPSIPRSATVNGVKAILISYGQGILSYLFVGS